MANYIGPPPGTVFQFAGSVAPTGYLLCDGSSLLRTTYADLFAAIGTTYGSVDGSHFTLPDGQGRILVGHGTHTDVSTLGNSDGLAAGSRRPKHKHAVNDPGHAHGLARHSTSSSGGPGSAQNGSLDFVESGAVQSATTGITVGPQTGSEPTDGPAYLVITHIIKF